MHRSLLALVVSLGWLTLAPAALADVASPGKCKCSTPGAPFEGTLTGVMLGADGVLLLVSRSRRRGR